MSGKQHKRELKRQKQAAREAARRAERIRTIQTVAVIAVVVALGGFLIYVSIDRGGIDAAAEALSEQAAATPEFDLASAPVACGAAEPATAASGDRPTFQGPPGPVLQPGLDYRAVVQTSCGRIVVDLAEQASPQTVNSFVFLAQQRFFNGLLAFRNATSIGALQTGSETNDARGNVGFEIPDELDSAKAEGYPPGSVAMANAGPDTGGSQFFFVYNDRFQLPPSYARFGQVVEGMDVLERIGEIEVAGAQGETPTERVYLESVTIETG